MIKIVVPISGGKDSQACLKLALMSYQANAILGIFCDTKFEHPITYEHIKKISEMYDVEIITLSNGSVVDIVKKFRNFPSSRFRMCTDRLKIQASKVFYSDFAKKNGGFEVWLGMRSGESTARRNRYKDIVDNNLYAPHEFGSSFPKYLGKMGVMFKLPILGWSETEVIDFLGKEKNQLYDLGSKRVGCFPCLASSDSSKNRDFNFDEFGRKQYNIVLELEKEIGKSVWTSKKGAMMHNENQSDMFDGCAFCAI